MSVVTLLLYLQSFPLAPLSTPSVAVPCICFPYLVHLWIWSTFPLNVCYFPLECALSLGATVCLCLIVCKCVSLQTLNRKT